MRDVVTDYGRCDRDLAAAVLDVVNGLGVPGSIDDCLTMANELMPSTIKARRYLTARELEIMAAKYPWLKLPEYGPWYPLHAQIELVTEAAGLPTPGPALNPATLNAEAATLAAARGVPMLDPEKMELFVKRLSAGMGRHARGASRATVIHTAALNGEKWARQLNGESCGFCALLVSRGAVYGSKSAKFRSHNHCDCTATIAIDNEYDGAAEARRLREQWEETRDLTEFRKQLEGEHVPA